VKKELNIDVIIKKIDVMLPAKSAA